MLRDLQPMSFQSILPAEGRIFKERLLTMAQASRLLPQVRGSKQVGPKTVYRWGSKGLKVSGGQRVRLEIGKVGGTNCTSLEALERFFRRLDLAEPVDPPTRHDEVHTTLKEQADAAMTILRQRGLIE